MTNRKFGTMSSSATSWPSIFHTDGTHGTHLQHHVPCHHTYWQKGNHQAHHHHMHWLVHHQHLPGHHRWKLHQSNHHELDHIEMLLVHSYQDLEKTMRQCFWWVGTYPIWTSIMWDIQDTHCTNILLTVTTIPSSIFSSTNFSAGG